MRLQEGSQYEKMVAALLVFSLDGFDTLLKFKLSMNREDIALGNNKQIIVLRVIDYYQTRNQVELLLQAAREFNPTDPTFQQLMQEFGFATQMAMVEDVSGNPQPIVPDNFEAYVTDYPMFDPQVLRSNMAKTEPCVCRVEDVTRNPQGVGTGFLVAPGYILTNNHVVKGRSLQNLKLRFDYAISGSGAGNWEGVTYDVEELVDHSEHSVYDVQVNPVGEATADELDFALLRVKGTPGADPIGGPASITEPARPARGYLKIGAVDPPYSPNTPLIIYQHPNNGPLKFAMDPAGIIGLNTKKTRVRYRTNTDGGSSGSPCFDANMNLIALHHAGDPAYYVEGKPPKFNQGVPIGLIWERVKGQINA